MAKKEKLTPGTDVLKEGASQLASDRAKRISSLHRSVDDLVQDQNKKRLQVSNEISSLTKEQQKLMMQLDMERSQFTSETASAYSGVIKGLGNTIKQLSLGVKNITVDTAHASSQAISQYGKAISEDINVNKTNTIAMALSRATPLFGYFAAKFVETDVFRDAASKIKSKLGSAVSAGLSKAGESAAGIFKKGKKAKEEHGIPKLQSGGFIKEGGMVQVHAAEVITPIDKLLANMDEAKSKEIAMRLGANLQIMAQTMNRMETVVVERDKTQKSIISTFIDEFHRARDPRREDWQTRMLKAILELKVATIGTASQLRIAWQRTLLQHPSFRAMLMFGQTMKTVLSAPWKMLFGIRGGYVSEVRAATRTSNVYMKMVNLLSILYTGTMTRLDRIALFTKASAEVAVGQSIRVGTALTYTWFDKIRERMTSRSIQSTGAAAFDAVIDNLGLDRRALKEAGVTSLSDMFGIGVIAKVFRSMGVTKENLSDLMKYDKRKDALKQEADTLKKKAEEAKTRGAGFFGGMMGRAKDYKGKVKDKASSIAESLDTLVKLKKDQEEREGPHSPSMADNIKKTAQATVSSVKERFKTERKKLNLLEKIKVKSSQTTDYLKGMGQKLKKWGKRIGGWIPIIFQAIISLLGKGFKKGAMLAHGGMSAAGTAIGAGTSYGFRGLGKVATKLKLGKVAKFGGKVAGRAAGIFTGIAMGGWDAVSAMRHPEEFAQSRMISGFAAFLGGKEGGFAGAKRGVLKGGAIGLGIGGPIGGAIGAIAGGILGFVGGKNLAGVIRTEVDAIKDMVSGIWRVVKYPFKIIIEGVKILWVLTKHLYKRLDNWLSGPGFIGYIWSMIKGVFGWIRDKIVYAVEWWKSLFNVKKIQEVLMMFMHPFSGIVTAVKMLGSWIDKTVSNIPIIGKLYKLSKKSVGKIDSMTLAKDLDEALDKTLPKPITVPSKYNLDTIPKERMPQTSDYLAAIAEKHAKRRAAEQEMASNISKKQTEDLKKAMEEGDKNQRQTMIATSNSVISSNAQTVTNISQGGGNGPPHQGFSTGGGYAANTTMANNT